MRKAYKIFISKLNGRVHSENLGVNGKIILEWMLGIFVWKVWCGCIWIRKRTSVGGCCEHGNERSSSIKGGEFLGSY
jgi:hypothetical protein